MTPDIEALARRAVACEGWRWMPGMRMLHPLMGPARVLRVTQQGVWVAKEESLASGFRVDEDGCLPDLSDPLTVQALLLLVREAWATQTAWAEPGHDGLWEMCVYVGGECRFLESYDSEVEALVAALEAAS